MAPGQPHRIVSKEIKLHDYNEENRIVKSEPNTFSRRIQSSKSQSLQISWSQSRTWLAWRIQFQETKRKVELQTRLMARHVHHYLSPSPSIIARIAKAVINPIIQYGRQFWQLTEKQFNTLDTAQRDIYISSRWDFMHLFKSRYQTRTCTSWYKDARTVQLASTAPTYH